MTKHNIAKSLLALPLLALTHPALAQEHNLDQYYDEAADFASEVIIVLGDPLPDALGITAYDKVEITGERLNNVSSGRIEDALRDVAGLQQFRRSDARSANPTSQGITLRGIGGNASSRALLLLDGVPQADPFGGWVSWPGYDALRLGKASVQRGGGSGAYGSGALSGTVELFSADPTETGTVNGGFAYGSRNSLAADVSVGGALGEGVGVISASYETGDGFIPIAEGQRGSVDRPAGYEQAGIAARAAVPISDALQIQANIRAFTDNRERGFAFSNNANDGADASVRLLGTGAWKWSALAYLQVRSFSASFGSVATGRNSVRQVFEQFNVPSEGLGARLEVRPPIGGKSELRIGADWRRTTGQTKENFFFQNGAPLRNRFAGGRSDTAGLFAELSVPVSDQVTITAGARADHWSLSDGFRRETNIGGPVRSDVQFADRSGWEPTGRLGLAWDGGKVKLRAAGYLGWRLPTLNELYRPFRVGPDATAANENLVPERLKGVEAGFEWSPVEYVIKVTGTVFHNELDDAIANVTLANGPGLFPGVGFVSGAGVFRQRQNLDKVKATGFEFDAKVDVNLFFARASYSYVDNKVVSAGPAVALNGLRPAQTPRHFASLQGGWRGESEGTGASVTMRYQGQRFDDDLNTRSLDDVFTMDARLGWRITDNLLVEARAENLFDAQVQTAISGAGIIERARPRTLWLGLRVNLD